MREATRQRDPRHHMGHTQKTYVPQVQKILAAATQVFVHDGYLKTRIQKIANEAAVSTRTIYEHFGNKADLFGAVIEQHVDRYVAMVVLPDNLEQLEIREALTSIAELLRRRACGYDAVVLFRIVASEATRFPDLAKTMRCRVKRRLEDTVADYFRTQVDRGDLVLSDPSRAALVFLQMVLAEVHQCLLFGSPDEIDHLNFELHLNEAIFIFLNGALGRE